MDFTNGQSSAPSVRHHSFTMKPNPSAISFSLVTGLTLFGLAFSPGSVRGQGSPAAATVSAANAFLATLNETQRAKAVFAFGDDAQRKRWSNLPSGIYQRAGLRLGDLNKAQREAALALLAAALSETGYEKVVGIMEGDEVLPKPEGNRNIAFGRDEYFLSLLGGPSLTDPWTIQFGGHHLALNVTLAGGQGTLAPSHTGAQPATFELAGKIVRPLGQENDLGFALINALDATQQKQAILGAKFRDLVLGPGQDGKTIVPEGVKASSFNEKQRELLLDLIRQWVGIIRDDAAVPKMNEIKAGLDETWFAWSGPTKPGGAAYFRIQGPAVFIEYAPQSLGGDPTRHIHTIYRDPMNEYGRKFRKP